MSDEEKLQDSLAAWVPPWQRAQSTPPPAEQAPDGGTPDGDDEDDVQKPETDSFEEMAGEAVIVSPEAELLEEMDLDVESAPEGVESAPEGYVESDTEPEHAAATATADRPEAAPDAEAAGDAPTDPDAFEAAGDASEPDEDQPTLHEPVTRRPDDLRGALEAILLVVDEPVSDATLADVLGAPVTDVIAELESLAAEYDEGRRGYQLRRAAGGWRLYTRGEFSAYVERFVLDGQSVRLTQAALETLAVVAYQQPVTRSRMAAIRGVNCDGVVRTLVTRGLIEECGTQPESGAFLYRTTPLFLEKLGLDSVDELPPLAPFLPDDVNGLVDAER